MSSLSQSFYTRIMYHGEGQLTDQFNGQTTMDQIHRHVREKIYCLKNKEFIIKINHPGTKQRINLNQNVLDYEYNPFKLCSSIVNTDPFSVLDIVDLYVVDDSLGNSEISQQISAASSTIDPVTPFPLPNSTPVAVAKESRCQEDLLVQNNAVNTHICHTGDLSGALLTHESDEQPVNNDHLLERALVGSTTPLQHHVPASNPSPNKSDRLLFSHDVKPTQKPIYMSDQFNQRDKTKTNGLVSFVQGKKDEKQTRCSVFPKIRIPGRNRNKRNAWLDIHVVYQKRLPNGKICWCKHPDKGFLPEVYTSETVPVNPISFRLDQISLSQENDFELPLRMTTKWDKSGTPEVEIHQLDANSAADLHPIVDLEPCKYDPCTPRLMGTIRDGTVTQWDTMCISDFIRSTITCKRAASNTDDNTTNRKRAKK